MHEVLAVLLFALQQEKDPAFASAAPTPPPTLRAALADPAYLEADAFLLFDKLLLHLEVNTYI